MKILRQLLIFFALCLFGECVSAILPFTLPGSIISMTVLFLLLLSGVLKISSVAETSDFLLGNMPLFLVPASLSIVEHYELLISIFVPIFVVCFVSMVLTFAATSLTVSFVSRVMNRKGGA